MRDQFGRFLVAPKPAHSLLQTGIVAAGNGLKIPNLQPCDETHDRGQIGQQRAPVNALHVGEPTGPTKHQARLQDLQFLDLRIQIVRQQILPKSIETRPVGAAGQRRTGGGIRQEPLDMGVDGHTA